MHKNDNSEWYKVWFNHLYPQIYPHRNLAEAQAQVSSVLKLTNNRDSCLDIACGTGRHLKFLAQNFKNAYGIDLSKDLIEIGKAQGNFTNVDIRISDMRDLPYESLTFDLITNFFTGFGYFNTDLEHQNLLNSWASILKSDGTLVIDYLNKNRIINELIPESTKNIDNYHIKEIRKISKDGLRVEKTIEINSEDFNQTFHESVRMYNEEELKQMISNSKLKLMNIFGDFNFEKFDINSPRIIIVAKK